VLAGLGRDQRLQQREDDLSNGDSDDQQQELLPGRRQRGSHEPDEGRRARGHDGAPVPEPVGDIGRREEDEETQDAVRPQQQSDDGDRRAELFDPERQDAEIGSVGSLDQDQRPEDGHDRLWKPELRAPEAKHGESLTNTGRPPGQT
jgi:hypothetical protein